MEREYFWWHGHRIHIHEEGEGQPLLLVNGLGGNTDMWRPFAQRFRGRRIISFDAPGAGRSSTPTQPLSISTLAKLAVAALDDRGVPQADVLGYSYGGAVAQQLAFEAPARVGRLVLAATTCGIGAVLGSLKALNVLATPFRYYSPTYFERVAKSAYGGRTGRNAEVRHRMTTARRKYPPSSYGYAMQLLGGACWSSWHFLERIPHETLVISGDDDPLIPVANAKMLARRIPRARLDIVERAGHLFLWDDAEHLGDRIRPFLEPSIDTTRVN